MKTDFEHLPEAKRQDLSRVLEILFRAFDDATRNRSGRRRGQILKVILFGSYARGDWVDEPVGGYRSSYDLLVVVNDDELTQTAEFWMDARVSLQQAYDLAHTLTAPTNFIVHSLAQVNRELARGRPFFSDIIRDGIALQGDDEHPFSRPTKLSVSEAAAEATANYREWLKSASGFARNAGYAIRDSDPKLAAFLLHQATERFYHCALFTQTLYSPKSHDLNLLRAQAERVAPELIPAWPRWSRFERRTWELLRRAYVEARFSSQYIIEYSELAWLVERITDLQARTERSCEAYLATVSPTRSATTVV